MNYIIVLKMVRVYVYSTLQLTTVLFANFSLVQVCGSFFVCSVCTMKGIANNNQSCR
jgi:hypothetical protein